MQEFTNIDGRAVRSLAYKNNYGVQNSITKQLQVLKDKAANYYIKGKSWQDMFNHVTKVYPHTYGEGNTLHIEKDKLDSMLRERGYSDEITHYIKHTGWFTDHFCNFKTRGIVYRLPAKKGEKRYIAGYEDDNTGESYVVLDFGNVFSEAVDAAHHGDRTAELAAEREREYRVKDQAEQDIYELEEEISSFRKEGLNTIKEFKLARKLLQNVELDTLCFIIRNNINTLRQRILANRERIKALKDNPYLAVEGY